MPFSSSTLALWVVLLRFRMHHVDRVDKHQPR